MNGQRKPTRSALALAILLVIALALELSVCNLAHWKTVGLANEIQPLANHLAQTDTSEAETSGEAIGLADSGSVELFHADLDNAELDSLAFDYTITGEVAVRFTISLSDSGWSHSTYDLPEIRTKGTGRIVTPVSPYGLAKSISIKAEIDSDDFEGAPTASIENVVINEPVPLNISPVRIIGMYLLFLLAWVIRPRSVLWDIKLSEWGKPARTFCVLLLVAVLGGMAVTYARSTDDSGASWYHSYAHDEYTELARGLARGNLYLDEVPADWLAQMDGLDAGDDRLTGDDNLLDPTARGVHWNEYDQPYKVDAVYFNGHYYVYFGIVPVVLAYLPFYVLTGHDLPNSYACLGALVLFAVFLLLLFIRLCRFRFKAASCGALLISYIGALLASGIVYTMARPSMYNTPAIFALAFAVMGVYFTYRGYTSKRRSAVFYALGSLFLAATLGCRPQLLTCAVPAFAILVLLIARKHDSDTRRADCLGIALPALVVVALLLAYNAARFGSPFDFGANYNLAGNDMTLRGFDLTRVLEAIFYYCFGTPRLTTSFPLMQPYLPDFAFMGLTIAEPFVSGVFPACPFLLAAIAYLAWRAPARNRVWWAILACFALGIFAAGFDGNSAGVLGRYQQDFGVLFGFAFALAALAYDDEGAGMPLRALLGVLLVVSVMLGVMIRIALVSPESAATGSRKGEWFISSFSNFLK